MLDMLSMKIFFQRQENDLGVLALTSKKNYYENNNNIKTAHPPFTQPTPIKFWHDKGSISGPRERVHRSLMK